MPLLDFSMPDLPVAECLPRLIAVLGAQPNAVLVAPLGAGKTTCVPLALLDAAPMDRGRCFCIFPAFGTIGLFKNCLENIECNQ